MKNIEVDFYKDNEQLILTDNQGEITVMDKNEGLEWISQKAFEHLQYLFPRVSVLHSPSTIIKLDIKDDKIKCNHNQDPKYFSIEEIKAIEELHQIITPLIIKKDIEGMFEFEVKNWFAGGSFHGTSNYYLHNPYIAEDKLFFKIIICFFPHLSIEFYIFL